MAGIPRWERLPIYLAWGRRIFAMVELLFMAQVVRRPLQTMARRWYCRNLFRATRGKMHCAECTKA
jgi:hypothetical protein